MPQHQHSRSHRSPRRTCTTLSLPPSGRSGSPWTPAGPGHQKCWFCPWPHWFHQFGPDWCRTLWCGPGTSTLHSRRTEARSDTGFWESALPEQQHLSLSSPRRGRLTESGSEWITGRSLMFCRHNPSSVFLICAWETGNVALGRARNEIYGFTSSETHHFHFPTTADSRIGLSFCTTDFWGEDKWSWILKT